MAIADTITRTNSAVDSLMDIRIVLYGRVYGISFSALRELLFIFAVWNIYPLFFPLFLLSAAILFFKFYINIYTSVWLGILLGLYNWMKFYASGFHVITYMHIAKQMKSDQLSTHTYTVEQRAVDRDSEMCIASTKLHYAFRSPGWT